MRAIVVGGGIVGLASAYYLARRDVDVVVYEKGTLANASTARSAGGIRRQFSTEINVELSKRSAPVWDGFEDEFDVDIAYRRVGYLFLARSSETAERFQANVDLQNRLGVPSEYLTPEEAGEHCPGLDPDPFVAATYLSTDGFADPYLAAQGFAGAARDAGARIETGTEVTDLSRRDGGVDVETDAESSETADYVVNAAGAWAGRIGRMAGIDVPIAPRRRQAVIVDPETPVPETDPLTIDLDTGSYFRPEREGSALVGGHFGDDDPDVDPDHYPESADIDWMGRALERAADYATYFGPDTRIKRGWSGLYAVTPDHHPVIEETVPGVVTAAGFSGHGFQHAPATGQVVAELVTEGEASAVDVSVLGSDRFERGEEIVEHNVA